MDSLHTTTLVAATCCKSPLLTSCGWPATATKRCHKTHAIIAIKPLSHSGLKKVTATRGCRAV